MRISDWSSDVCSSDLAGDRPRVHFGLAEDRVAEAQFVDDDVQRRHAGGVDVVVGRRFLFRRRLVGAALLRRRIPEHARDPAGDRCASSGEHTSEPQSLMRISSAVLWLKKKTQPTNTTANTSNWP